MKNAFHQLNNSAALQFCVNHIFSDVDMLANGTLNGDVDFFRRRKVISWCLLKAISSIETAFCCEYRLYC